MSKRKQLGDREIPVNVAWVHYKLSRVKGRLRVLIYARFSKDEQNPRSIDDQVAYCRRFLAALGFTDVEIDVLYDEGISGEKLFRPGIDRVRAGIDARQYDLILVEDCSRLFRNARGCMELVGDALEAGIRVFCINDEVDTADEEHWEEKLYEAASHHQRSNKFTSKRIMRALEALWQMGAAIGLLKPGYLRTAKHPAADGEQKEGPFFDSIDPDQAPTIATAYERIAAHQSPKLLAAWLTGIGLPKASNSRSRIWTAKNVIDLIRRPDYRGWQTYRNKTSKRKRGTGNRQSRRNDPGQIWTRSMPHQRIVPDWLWHAANRAINERGSGRKVPQGDEHPLAGIPRDSRGPLSKVIVCGRCGEKMYVEGRNEGGYRCADARGNGCWNKASALRDLTHGAIGRAIIDQLQSLGDKVNELAQRAAALLDDHGQCEARRAELVVEERELKATIKTLNDALERAGESPDSTVLRISQRDTELANLQGELDGLIAQDERIAPPIHQEIAQRIDALIGRCESMDRTARDDLALLVGTIKAVPYRQFDSNKVVLRARFELRLGALLPERTRAALESLHPGAVATNFERIELLVDLFEPSTGPRHGLAAIELKEQQHLGLTAIGRALKITKRRANLAVQYGAKLRAAGLTDPFIELTAPPSSGSRWGPRRDHGRSPDRRAG